MGRVKYFAMTRVLLCLLIVFSGNFVPRADAALSCEQLIVVSQTTLSLRDQGVGLSAILAEVERSDLRQNLDAQQINLLRQIVRVSFTSEFSPREVLEACKSGSLGIAKPKP